MECSVANCPVWLEKRIEESQGQISFSQFMDWSLNDRENGFYGSGRLKIDKKGDFVTSPSLGADFAELLSVQILDWLKQLEIQCPKQSILTLIDIGPGEGHLSRDLLIALKKKSQALFNRIQLILVEKNQGMVLRQKKILSSIKGIKISWKSIDQLKESPVEGIVIANEFFDALPVERLTLRNKNLYRQGISLLKNHKNTSIKYVDLPLSEELKISLNEIQDSIGIAIPPEGAPEGWSTEWHYELSRWFEMSTSILKRGIFLVIDYVLEAYRYYNPKRLSGTIISYRNNCASENILYQPGYCDITSHLCLETLLFYAEKNGWDFVGQVRQGQALLALGLAEKLYSLSQLSKSELASALEKRENLLRLVDPYGLGEFRWIVFQVNNMNLPLVQPLVLNSRFMNEPIEPVS